MENNLRKYTSKKDWDNIRLRTYDEYEHRGGICRAEGRLHCHKKWKYNGRRHVQKLVGFIALCNMCHFVKHMMVTEILASQGKSDYKEVVEHFMKINKCSRKTFKEHKERALRRMAKAIGA